MKIILIKITYIIVVIQLKKPLASNNILAIVIKNLIINKSNTILFYLKLKKCSKIYFYFAFLFNYSFRNSK